MAASITCRLLPHPLTHTDRIPFTCYSQRDRSLSVFCVINGGCKSVTLPVEFLAGRPPGAGGGWPADCQAVLCGLWTALGRRLLLLLLLLGEVSSLVVTFGFGVGSSGKLGS